MLKIKTIVRFSKWGLFALFICVFTGIATLAYWQRDLKLTQLLRYPEKNDFAIIACNLGECNRGFFVEMNKAHDSSEQPVLDIASLSELSLTKFSSLLANSKDLLHRTGLLQVEHIGACNQVLRDTPERMLEIVVNIGTGKSDEQSVEDVTQPDAEPKCFFRIDVIEDGGSVWGYYWDRFLWFLV